MARSDILSGSIQQRDRAQQRGRRDRDTERVVDEPERQLEVWIQAHHGGDALDASVYLHDTVAIEMSAEQRLRHLAIHLEDRLAWREEQPRAWLAIDRL